MNAKNNKDVIKAILHFTAYLLGSVGLAVCIFASYMKTSVVEMRLIFDKSAAYDQLHMKQVVLTESIDSIYYYSNLVQPNTSINHSLMLNTLSTRSILFEKELESMGSDDFLIYKRLSANMDNFFKLKDSIRTNELQLDQLREEYRRCMNNIKDMNRRLYNRNIY